MTNNDIEGILKMRMAVYQEGIKAGFWTDLNQSGASELMDYLFPKSGQLAYYNLLMEMMKSEHGMLTGGVYFLFKMPVQVEKEIADFLKSHDVNLTSLVPNAETYLKEMDTIITDHRFDIVCVGSFAGNTLDNLLRLCASHYRHAFANNVKSFPYFE